jgi:hypothetical protein
MLRHVSPRGESPARRREAAAQRLFKLLLDLFDFLLAIAEDAAKITFQIIG